MAGLRACAVGSVVAVVLGLAALPVWADEARLDTPLVKQPADGCGAASLAMVFQYWNARGAVPEPPTVQQIHSHLAPDEQRGIRLADMKGYATEQGFHAFTLRASRNQLEEHVAKGRPIIVGLRRDARRDLHYVVVTGFEADKVWINDPGLKKPRRLGRKKFDRRWAMGDRWALIAVPAAAERGN